MAIPLAVSNLLASNNIQIHPTWLAQCVAYVRSTSAGAITDNHIAQGVMHQYIHTDLGEMGLPVLPNNVTDAHNIVIGRPKGIVLQINDIHEVGASTISLLELILDFKPKKGEPPRPPNQKLQFPRKMLKMTLTDGFQELPAMECSFLHGIALDSMLGMKVDTSNDGTYQNLRIDFPHSRLS